MEIRFLMPEDAVEWHRLRAEALERDPEAFSSSSEEHARLSLDDVKKRLGPTDDSFVAAAFEDGRLVGMAGFNRETGPKVSAQGQDLGCIRNGLKAWKRCWPRPGPGGLEPRGKN